MKRIHFFLVVIGLIWIGGVVVYLSRAPSTLNGSDPLVGEKLQEEGSKVESDENAKPEKPVYTCQHIDLVYTWVNGSEPDHINSRSDRAGHKRYSSPGNNRFRDLMGLRYSLRSVKKFAPWIRNVWVVSASQYPSWFDQESDTNIKFIFHNEYYTNKEDLPTFNSNSIESNFYSLSDEVSDCFIYFNDDIFIGAPINMNDFWDPIYGQAIYKSSWTAPQPKEKQANIWHACIAYTNELLNNLWEVDNTGRHYASHGHQFFYKPLLKRMYRELTDDFKSTSANPFRTAKDLQIPFLYLQYVIRHYATFEPPAINYYALIQDDLDKMRKEYARILAKKSKTYCLNDGLSQDKPNEQVVIELEQMFEKYFPEKGEWEL